LCGFAQGNDYAVYNNNLTAIERAVKERVFFVDYGRGFEKPHQPKERIFTDSLSKIKGKLDGMVRYTAVWTMEKFVGTYTGRRRTIYENAWKSLTRRQISRKDSYVNSFVKQEKYNFTKKVNPAPRIIQPRNPRYIVESGRFVKPIEKKIYKHINAVFGATTIFKGLNAEHRGRVMRGHWDAFADPVAVGLDAKRFDQHVSIEALEWEHSIYQAFYPGNKHFAMLLEWQRRNTCYARCSEGTVKYKTVGKRMSGDVNTALGNCLIMSSMVWTYADEISVPIRLANDGDDCGDHGT